MTKLLASSLTLLLCSAGCSSPPAETGLVTVALVTGGSGGAVYRLPAATSLIVSGPTYYDGVSLDGDGDEVAFDLPPGDYTAALANPFGYSTVWPLVRERADGVIETVQATLVPPAGFIVAAGQTTALVLEFRVATGQIISFSHGTVRTILDVMLSTASAYDVSASAPLSTSSVIEYPDIAPGLAARLPAEGASGLNAGVTVRIVGAWRQTSSKAACTDAELHFVFGEGHAGFADLVTQAIPTTSTAVVCIVGNGPDDTSITVAFAQQRRATTATFADLGDRWLDASVSFAFGVARTAFDGSTLDLQALAGTYEAGLLMQTTLYGSHEGEGLLLGMYDAVHEGRGTLTFLPL
jgi:hypothetical protein